MSVLGNKESVPNTSLPVFMAVSNEIQGVSPFFPVCVNNYISIYGMSRPRTLFLDSFILLLAPNHYTII